MNAITNFSRRGVLKGMAAGGFVLAVPVASCSNPIEEIINGSSQSHSLNLYLKISQNGDVEIVAMSPEIGQGARTAMPMIIADELEADWSRVSVTQAGPDPRLGDQGVGGSSAIRENWDNLRLAGATARTMLEMAASEVWAVPIGEVKAEFHQVVHSATGRTLGYGELALIAAGLETPAADKVRLKSRADYRYIGTDMAPVDLEDIVLGRAIYGIDTIVEGMKYAVIARSPVVGGKFKSYNADAALAIPGVEQVVEISGGTLPPGFNSIGGIAVIANNTWIAKKAVDVLEIEWDGGPNANYESAAYKAALEAEVAKPGETVRNLGDVETAFSQAEQILEAEYWVPHHVHAQMEPPAALADVKADRATVWMPTQGPQGAHSTIAAALGFENPSRLTLHVTLAGGGFGRKGKPDYGVEAALLSQQIGAPVKVTWTREDDTRHGYYHACAAQYLKAGLDAGGRPTAWLHRVAFPSISSTFAPNVKKGASFELGLGLVDMPYNIPNIRCENGEAEAHVRIGWFRSVNNINHGFAVGSFIDELAKAAGRDTGYYILELLDGPEHVDLAAENTEYSNYGKDIAEYPIDRGRLANVVKLVMADSRWGREMPEGSALGIAVHRSFLTYVACVVEVNVSDGELRVPEVYYAVDCGPVVNTDRVRAQFEGGAIYALSHALYGEITARDGAIEQSNFHDYQVCRIDAAPTVHVRMVNSDHNITGVGEPPVPPFAPALTNAIHSATGKRIRQLPVAGQLRET